MQSMTADEVQKRINYALGQCNCVKKKVKQHESVFPISQQILAAIGQLTHLHEKKIEPEMRLELLEQIKQLKLRFQYHPQHLQSLEQLTKAAHTAAPKKLHQVRHLVSNFQTQLPLKKKDC